METIVQLDVLSVTLIIGFVLGIILAAFFFLKQGNRKANRLFSAFIISALICFLYAILLPTKLYYSLPHLILARYPFAFLIGPFLYFYVKTLIQRNLPYRPLQLAHFLPAFACLCIMIPFYARDAAFKVQYVESSIRGNVTNVNFLMHLAFLQALVYLIVTYRMLFKFSTRIKDCMSTIDIVKLNWIRNLVSIAFIAIVLCIPLFVLYFLGFKLGNIITISYLAALFVCFGVLFVGFRVWLQPDVSYENHLQGKKEKYRKSILSSQDSKEHYARLIRLMEAEKLFLDPELDLAGLSQAMSLNTRYLSQVINENSGQNFYDFVNGFRIEEAKRSLSDPGLAHRDILGIAFDAGFNSKTTFNTLFKKYAKLTPSQFRKKTGN